ncbi:tetratricopeptide repeat protein [Prochlorococcus marinus]|uniref:tetratricopeptide repeat protein n=1 Tax=Prochlorococcus marinus TaxID=1219 RepID=UPI0022B3AAD3|nr:tetratricopeptide repeat protein [Prochlorococcus marinus]
MEKSDKQEQRKNKLADIKIFPVPFLLEVNEENLTINTNTPTKPSREQIINQAFQYHSQGNISEAAKYYQYFINEGFNDHRVFSNYGTILANLGNLEEAELSYRKAIELNPDYEKAHSNLGSILSDLENLEEAELSYRKAIELKPDHAEALYNLGIILKDLGKLEEAELSYCKAIGIKPDFAEAYSNLGVVLKDLGKLKEAELSQRKAIELNPDCNEASWNLSHLELLQGDYRNGLENYEFRFKINKPIIPHGKTKIKKVTKEKLQKGEKLLVVSEQAPGDVIFYMRYLLPLKQQGIDLSFCAPEKLHNLIQDSGIHSNPLSPEQCSLVKEGKWIPLLSLLKYFSVNPHNPVINTPYISSTKTLKEKWRNILFKEKRPIVGVNWQGNPEMEKIYQGRSIPLEIFSKLLEKNDIRLISFQKGFGSEQMEKCSFKEHFVSCQDQIDSIWDYSETSAIVENCDLIITNDCSLGPLAAGMGKKVWLLLRDVPFWYWGLTGDTTFWYPSMRLFRQKKRHDWQEVMERVSIALSSFQDVKHDLI